LILQENLKVKENLINEVLLNLQLVQNLDLIINLDNDFSQNDSIKKVKDDVIEKIKIAMM